MFNVMVAVAAGKFPYSSTFIAIHIDISIICESMNSALYSCFSFDLFGFNPINIVAFRHCACRPKDMLVNMSPCMAHKRNAVRMEYT